MQSWKMLSRRVLLNHSKYLVVEEHTVELPDGRVIENWPWLITPDFVNVVAVTEDGQFVCFRQTKYAIDGDSLAPVGGFLEPGEEPLVAAQRELLEETGYEAAEWIPLGHYRVDGNRGAGVGYFYLACGARRVAEATADDLEEQEMLLLSRANMEVALAECQFKALTWVAIVALALRAMEDDR